MRDSEASRPNRNRILEVHFYEWRLLSWATSDTRDRLDAAGRGIYRELIDQCYAKGSFPADLDYIQRKCACTLEEYERTWPIIKKQFRLDARKNEYHHALADTFRRSHFSYIETQRSNGSKGGRPAISKSSDTNKLETSGLRLAKPGGYENDNPTESLKKEIKERKKEETENPPLPPPPTPPPGSVVVSRNGMRVHGQEQVEIDVAGFVDRLWKFALNRKDRILAEQSICGEIAAGRIGNSGTPYDVVERRWKAQNATENWRWKNGAKAQTLGNWISDRNYEYDPPSAEPEPDEDPYRNETNEQWEARQLREREEQRKIGMAYLERQKREGLAV